MSESNFFLLTVESLLTGHVICEYAYEDLSQYLQDEMNRTEVDRYLMRIGRQLRQTNDQSAYFAVYTDIDGHERRKDVQAQFADVINHFEPLVRWLHMVQSAERIDRPVTPGDVLKSGEILESLENSPVLSDEVVALSKSKLFSNNQSTLKGQIDAIFKKLVEYKYLITVGRTGSQYIATGKWSRLYDLMEFINTHEQLDAEIEEQQQGLGLL